MRALKIICAILLFQTKVFAQIPTIEDKNIKIQSVDMDSKIIGNTAVTKVTYILSNTTSRDLEGKLTFPLAEGVTVSQYAIDINGKLRNAVPVAKERGKEIFESIQHRQVDPGLIEKVSGNNYRLRVSPISAKGIRTVQVTFLHDLKANSSGNLEYLLAFGNTTYPKFNLNITYLDTETPPKFIENPDGSLKFQKSNKQWNATLSRENFTPNSALRIELPINKDNASNSIFQSASANQFYFINTIQVKPENRKFVLPNRIAIVWDNSLSASDRDFTKEWNLLHTYLTQLPSNSQVDLYYLNNEFKLAQTFSTDTKSIQDLKNKLSQTVYDGATDFSLLKDIPQLSTVLLFSDGIASFGDLNKNLKNKYYAITSFAKSDFSLLRYISEKNGGALINLNELDLNTSVSLLTSDILQFLGVKNSQNVREVYPAKSTITNNQINLAGILSTSQGSFTALFGYGNQVTKEIQVNLKAESDVIVPSFNVAQIWAQKKIADLEVNYFDNKKEIMSLSNQFAVVSKNTSLIVLEDVEDYVKYQITPPEELLASYNSLLNEQKKEYAASKKSILNKIAQKTQELKMWHATDFTTTTVTDSKYPKVKLQSMSAATAKMGDEGYEGDGDYYEEGDGPQRESRAKIILAEINSNASYMKEFAKLQQANDIYALYLKKRAQYKHLSKFYFDISNLLYSKDKALALKVLSSLADLDLENEELFKTLHYVLKQRNEFTKDLFVTQKILEWRPFDPQSHRDYALALLDNKRPQEALNVYRDLIYQDFTEELSTRDNGIEEILVMEINNIISRFPQVNKDKVNKAFQAELPVDIRVVLNWNKDQTDIDLWITDPNKEDCYYSNRNTKIGGRLSNDFVDGFGPEQFLLKKAIKGTYQIKTNFFAERQLNIEEPTAVMAEVYLYYSTGKEERKIVVFQYDNSNANSSNDDDRKTLVGQFVF